MCQSCEWKETLEELNELCADSDYEWANNTLSAVADWVEKYRHITAHHVAVVANIKRVVEDR